MPIFKVTLQFILLEKNTNKPYLLSIPPSSQTPAHDLSRNLTFYSQTQCSPPPSSPANSYPPSVYTVTSRKSQLSLQSVPTAPWTLHLSKHLSCPLRL